MQLRHVVHGDGLADDIGARREVDDGRRSRAGLAHPVLASALISDRTVDGRGVVSDAVTCVCVSILLGTSW